MADPYDLANLNAAELELYTGTLSTADYAVVIVSGKPYTTLVSTLVALAS